MPPPETVNRQVRLSSISAIIRQALIVRIILSRYLVKRKSRYSAYGIAKGP